MNATAAPSKTTNTLPQKGDILELTIESLAFGGQGVARHDGLVVVLPKGTSPGSTVRAMVTRRKRGFVEARTLEVLSPSPDAVEAPCAHFGVCGGCATQNLAYEVQLAQKQAQVGDLFARMGGFTEVEVQSIIGCKDTLYYRNKMEFTYSTGCGRWTPRKRLPSAHWACMCRAGTTRCWTSTSATCSTLWRARYSRG